jgi:nucleotidyltransferase-like protein
MSDQDPELEAFSKFIAAIEPWLGEVVLVGGWAHRLYRLDPRARKLDYLPLTTLDGDVAVPPKLKKEESTVRKRLLEAGFEEEFIGEDRPPATHYHYGKGGGFYAEFLAPLEGSEYDRHGKRKATKEVGGISSQLLRYIEILLISPWKMELGEENGYALSAKRPVQIANPASFLAQKILIHPQRDYKDRAKDLLYMHDTIEVFSENLDELQKLFRSQVAPKLHARRIAELQGAPERLFGKVDDTIREAALMAAGRKLSSERLAETAQAGLKEIFGKKAA